MKEFSLWFGGFVAFILLVIGLNWLGLFTARPMAKYQAETDKQVYDTSRQFQQGTNRDVARYCEQMRTASNDSAKKAVASLIRSTLSTYNGPLSSDNQACAAEAGAN